MYTHTHMHTGIAANNDKSRLTQRKKPVKDEIPKRTLSAHFIITTIFTSNFIGIVFARTLHYQFYVWYFHTLPYLLWHAQILPIWGKIFVLLSIEVSFNVYPATAWSSALLQVRRGKQYQNMGIILKVYHCLLLSFSV